MVESIRFSGLASGMDTQSIVDSMMRASRLPLDKLQQQKQVLEWQRDDYREMNKLLKEFDQFLFDGIYRQSNMLKRSATTSNDQYITATASAEAGNVSYKIENVTLAKSARRISSDLNAGDSSLAISNGQKIDPTKSIWSQKSNFFNPTDAAWSQKDMSDTFTVPADKELNKFQLTKGAISFSSPPSSIDVEDSNNNITSFTVFTDKSAYDADTTTTNKVFIDEDKGTIEFNRALTSGENFKVDYKHNFLEVGIKTFDESGNAVTKQFSFDGTMSINQMFNQINTSDAGVNIFYDSGSDKVVATRTDTGDFNTSGKEIQFVNPTSTVPTGVTRGDGSSFFTSVLGLDDSTEIDGSDVQFTINGLTTTRKSNTFTMNGVTFTLKKDMAAGDSATISSSTDVDGIYKTIKDFVDKYNEMIGKINGKLTEERFRTFTPLSDEQKASMKDKEIEQWEVKAKSGLIRRDSLLTSGLNKMRMDMYAEVTSNSVTLTDKNYNQLSEIGIKTTKDYNERGKLEIDETKLKEALEKNPEAVYQLFMADGPTYEQKGLARRLRDSIDDTMRKVEEKAGNTYKTEHGYSMGQDLLRIKDDIDSWEERLKQIEQRYWNQFNAMETAMQQMNNQSNQLMAQLGSMQK